MNEPILRKANNYSANKRCFFVERFILTLKNPTKIKKDHHPTKIKKDHQATAFQNFAIRMDKKNATPPFQCKQSKTAKAT